MNGVRPRLRPRVVRAVVFVGMSVLAWAQLGASCVDGVTPDCSDASVCGPTGLASPGTGATGANDAGGDGPASASDASDPGVGDAADGG